MQTGCQCGALVKPGGDLAGRALAGLFSLCVCWQTWQRLLCICAGLSLLPAAVASDHQSHSHALSSLVVRWEQSLYLGNHDKYQAGGRVRN